MDESLPVTTKIDAPVARQGDLFSVDAETTSRDTKPARTKPRVQRAKSTPSAPPEELDRLVRETLARELAPSGEPDVETESEADVLPARMLNEFVYCPRLFFYEHVDGIFRHNADTEKGRSIHLRVDKGKGDLAAAEAVAVDGTGDIHSRSVQLGSKRLGVSAKLDLVESGEDGGLCPVDYKAGKPREGDEGREIWPADRMQLGLQMLLLRENGYACTRGFIYYRLTKQRVPLDYSAELEGWIGDQVRAARELVRSRVRPDPLVDSPKCPRCSLASVCLPDETNYLADPPAKSTAPAKSPRRLIAGRDDERALYLNTQGLHVGIKDRVLDVREGARSVEQIRLGDVHHVALFGGVQLSTQAIQRLCREEIPLTYFSMGGWFHGITRGHSLSNVLMRRAQFRAGDDPVMCLRLARQFVSGKILNSRTMLMRNALVQPEPAIRRLGRASDDALAAESLESLLGIEGAAARVYFSEFPSMLKPDDDDEIPGLEASTPSAAPPLTFDFRGRNRRPPTDPVNALLSLAYSVLAKDCTIALLAVGFDPWLGFYHQPRPGRPALALDLMEEFRPLIAESAVLSAVNNRMLGPEDFVRAGEAVNLSEVGRKKFFNAYERRMSHVITHPVFDYKVSYRRAIELQARLLARTLEGEIAEYVPFKTR